MSARLAIHAPELDPEELQELTRRLAQTINRETDFQAELPHAASEAGDKGLAELFGLLTLDRLKSAVEPLIEVLSLYFQRSESLAMEFQCPDGRASTVKIRATDLDGRRVGEVIRLTRKFLDDC
jgi:hypothetical protein